jgi:hypothetical protein
MGYNTTRQIGGIIKITVDEENLRQTGGRNEINALLEVKNPKKISPIAKSSVGAASSENHFAGICRS